MTMALPQPSPSGNRPAYLDNLFNRNSSGNASVTSSISSSSTVSLSTSMSDLRTPTSLPRPLSPAFEDEFDDRLSVRSKKSFISPRSFRFGRLFNRRTYPQFEIQEINHHEDVVKAAAAAAAVSSPPTAPPSEASSPTSVKRTSFPKTRNSLPSRGPSLRGKPPVTIPPFNPQELSCHRCYYFAARNCNGWVMGGASGDSCETCLQAGFFGAK